MLTKDQRFVSSTSWKKHVYCSYNLIPSLNPRDLNHSLVLFV